uniref:Bacteriophage T5 Orf172 DNA-binding domain-containing protein n=1 Tax=uncultured bacterium contig00036 TaxID=1181524 RepID=A0A806KM99_9BACT|nr:hypothetical protein [uncultured bacterium contig00036]
MSEQSKNGVIYVLTNPSFPDFVKIGYADNLNQRLEQLNHSECIPFAFRPYAVCEVDRRLADKDIHSIIDRLNPNLRSKEVYNGKERVREFFAMTADSAFELLKSIAGIFGDAGRVQKVKPTGSEILTDMIASELKDKVEQKQIRLKPSAFSHITKEHIFFSAAFIDKQGIPPKSGYKTRNVVINGKKYAPKYIMALAYLYAKDVAENDIAQKIQEQRILHQFATGATFPIYKKLGFEIET